MTDRSILEDTIATVLARIRDQFPCGIDAEVEATHGSILGALLDEEGPEALVEAVLRAAGAVPAEPATHDRFTSAERSALFDAMRLLRNGKWLTPAEREQAEAIHEELRTLWWDKPAVPAEPATHDDAWSVSGSAYPEINTVCCEAMRPRLDADADDPTVWAIVCEFCGADLAFLCDRHVAAVDGEAPAT